MRINIGGETYPLSSLDDLTLNQLMRLERESADAGRPMKWRDLRAMIDRVGKLEPDDVEGDDDFLWYIGLIVWASRVSSGEKVNLSEALDFRLVDLEFEPDEGELLPGPVDPPLPRTGSGRGGDKRKAKGAARKASSPKTSASPSSGD